MKRLTMKRVNGIKTGYWSAANKEEVVQRLAAYENTGLEPEEIGGWISSKDRLPDGSEGDWVIGVVTGKGGSTYYENASVMVSFDTAIQQWYLDEYPEEKITVSYWMPVPDQPEVQP